MLFIVNYDVLIELSCDKAKSYSLADLHAINYIGVDIRESIIKKLEKSNYNNVVFYCFDSLATEKLFPLIANKKTLFLFPLNLAGNISNIKDILISYKKIINADIILSMW
ncbi:hypothetical protein HPDP_00388 [Candidatus Hepatincola sp. Pdp]